MRHCALAAVIMLVVALVPNTAWAGGNGAGEPSVAGNTSMVASGFSSPRGVVFFHGQLLVAEAGTGGSYCNGKPPPDLLCIGNTSQISRVNTTTGAHKALISGLFSAIENHGGPDEALGAEGLSTADGRILNIVGLYPQAIDDIRCATGDLGCTRAVALARTQAGHLISVGANGSLRSIASVGGYNYDWTVGKPLQEHDANPYGVLGARGGAYVADAGSNTLNFVTDEGRISVRNYFPFRDEAGFPTDEVPTCVARTDSSLWVGTLAGHLYRVNATRAIPVPMPLLHHVTGCTAGRHDTLYLVNMWTGGEPTPFTGNIVKFNAHGATSSIVAAGLDFPNMATVGPDGNLYVTADSVCPATGLPFCPQGGTVWKVRLQPKD
jgi:hypothetical protein